MKSRRRLTCANPRLVQSLELVSPSRPGREASRKACMRRSYRFARGHMTKSPFCCARCPCRPRVEPAEPVRWCRVSQSETPLMPRCSPLNPGESSLDRFAPSANGDDCSCSRKSEPWQQQVIRLQMIMQTLETRDTCALLLKNITPFQACCQSFENAPGRSLPSAWPHSAWQKSRYLTQCCKWSGILIFHLLNFAQLHDFASARQFSLA